MDARLVHPVALAGVTTIENRFPAELRTWRLRRGQSQLDLSNVAGTTQRHLSYLEQGRSAPSRTMVARLAEALGLSLRDRNGLLLAAGYAPLFPESALDSDALRPAMEALGRILAGHEPYPAVVARPDGEIVAANRAIDVLTEGADPELLRTPMNGFRLALHPQGMAPRIRNFPEWARHVLDALQAAQRRSPDDDRARLLDELRAYVPAAAPGPDHLGFAVPLRLACPEGELTLITTLTSFATALDVTLADLRLEAFLPADAGTARILVARAAARGTGAPRSDGPADIS
jgi:transcriptional regulator with XRE-family HTH domain